MSMCRGSRDSLIDGHDVPAERDRIQFARAEAVWALTEGDGMGEAEAARDRADGPAGVHAPDLARGVGGDVEAAHGIDRQTVEKRGPRPGRRQGYGSRGR